MRKLIHIELIKIRSNATFWVLAGLHAGIILLVLLSGKIFLRSIDIGGDYLGNLVDPAGIPLYQFPDIWHNFAYIAAYLKFILALYVIISITSEISYDTLRQNVMNGLSRTDFILSKLGLILIMAAASTVFLFVVTLVTGLVSTPDLTIHNLVRYSGFIPAYFLELTVYLVFALLIGMFVRRTGLAIGLLFLYTLIIEPVIALRIRNDVIKGLLPLKAINNLIHMPFGRYALREIQNYVALHEVLIALLYLGLFIYLTYLLLQKRDL